VPGYYVAIYDGTRFALHTGVTELSLALDSDSGHTGYHQSGRNFDFFIINDGGTLRLATGPSWNAGAVAGSDTARGTGAASTAIELFQGVWVNTNSITARFGSASGNTVAVAARQATFVGTGRMTANGQIEDSLVKRFLWNAHNQARRPMLRRDSTVSWTYSTLDTFQQANASTANQLAFVSGLAGVEAEAECLGIVANSTSTGRNCAVAIGLDSSTVNASDLNPRRVVINQTTDLRALWRGFPGLGYHELRWLESGGGTDTQTWLGADGSNRYRSGISGWIWG
jgi:hypothetical protein